MVHNSIHSQKPKGKVACNNRGLHLPGYLVNEPVVLCYLLVQTQESVYLSSDVGERGCNIPHPLGERAEGGFHSKPGYGRDTLHEPIAPTVQHMHLLWELGTEC